MTKLILNADDFGLRRSINDSIHNLLKLGVISSATILVKREQSSLEYAVEISKEYGTGTAGFGLHLDLDEFFNFDKTGNFGMHENDVADNYQETIASRQNELREDIVSQIQTLKDTGIDISHIDGHHNVHQFVSVLKMLCPIMHDFNISAMRFVRSFYKSNKTLGIAKNTLEKYSIKTPDAFFDLAETMADGWYSTDKAFNTIEIMVHSDSENSPETWRADQYRFLQENHSIIGNSNLISFHRIGVL